MQKKILCLIFSLVIIGLTMFFIGTIRITLVDESIPDYNIAEEFITSPSVCETNQEVEYMYYKETETWWEENNKFGIYIYAENKDYFELAQNLVNSNGGKWGYVLIPYNMGDRDFGKWSRVFEQLIKKQLIPVVQLWLVDTDNYEEQTIEAAEFLNRFLWPIKYKYISVYNEPNDANFWYGRVDPAEYARILDYTIDEFKKVNPDYFMMNGALNVSATTNLTSMEAFLFMRKMNEEVPGIFNKLDAWASHPYPQPNFSGNPETRGRWSIRAYEDELKFLKNELGVDKDYYVFITETGWAHAEGESYNSSFHPVDVTAEYFKYAYKEVWLKDDRVRAVMPFTIRYKPPFDHFSWVNSDGVPYKHFEAVKSMKKVNGKPPVIESAKVIINLCTP